MDHQVKTKPISLNLKLAPTVDLKKSKDKNSLPITTKSSNDIKQNESNEQSKDKKSTEFNQSTKSNYSNSSTLNGKRKVPFDLTNQTNSIKPEVKYAKENTNLRVINRIDETRKEILQSKIITNKPINKPNDCNLDNSKSIKSNQSSNKSISSNSSIQSSVNKQVKSQDKANTNRLGDFYLKIIPDPFNFLENDDDDDLEAVEKCMQMINNLNSSKNLNQNKSSQSISGNQSNKESSTPSATNLSLQFLKNQKESLEIEELINFKITNEDEKMKAKDVIDNLMKALIEYKQSSYSPQLVDDLNDSMDKIIKKS